MGCPLIPLLAVGGAAVSLLFGIVGCATPQWIYLSLSGASGKLHYDYGLWQVCATVTLGSTSSSSCVNLITVGAYIYASRAFSILGILAAVGCVVLSSLSVYYSCSEQLETKKMVTIGLLVTGGILALMQMIAFAVYIGEVNKNAAGTDIKPGYSSVLSLIAGLIGIGIAVASLLELCVKDC